MRLPSTEALLNNNADAYVQQVINAMDDAQKNRRTTLYNGFLGIFSKAKSGKPESLAGRFFASGSPYPGNLLAYSQAPDDERPCPARGGCCYIENGR